MPPVNKGRTRLADRPFSLRLLARWSCRYPNGGQTGMTTSALATHAAHTVIVAFSAIAHCVAICVHPRIVFQNM